MYRNIFKPIFDFLASIIGVIILLPLIFIITIILYIANKGKPFFFQQRPGKGGRIIKVAKFKTMNEKRDLNGNFLSDEKRLTKIGRLIRKTSIDEVLQLFNVIKGDMSLIGPRPLLVEYLPLYDDFQKRRHDVRPGITGWAQVNGRNNLSWGEKFKYDVWYVDNLSFKLDFKIIYMTAVNVFTSKGISQEGQATMEKFEGNKKQ